MYTFKKQKSKLNGFVIVMKKGSVKIGTFRYNNVTYNWYFDPASVLWDREVLTFISDKMYDLDKDGAP